MLKEAKIKYKLVASVVMERSLFYGAFGRCSRHSIIICELDKKVLTFEGTLKSLYSIPSESSNIH